MPFSSVLGASSAIKPGVCTSTTRPSVPFEGQLIYETDTDRVAAYNGSAWVYTHSSGLVLISSTTIGNAVASVTVSNAFSETYDNYKIIISGGVASTATYLKLTLGATATNYYYAGVFTSANWGLSLAGDSAANAAHFVGGGATTTSLSGSIELFAPNLAKATTYNTIYSDMRTAGTQQFYGGYLNNSTQYTAFTLTTAAGTVTGGTIRVYGYANS